MFDLKAHVKANTVDEAIRFLDQNPNARLIAGGTDVLIKLRCGDTAFSELVDINGLKALRYIKIDQQKNICIGSGAVFTDIIESQVIQSHIPVLSDAAASVGGPQVRNVATIGGNICNGVTSADSASALFVLNAILELKGVHGSRQIPVEAFYKGPGKVDLKPSEVLFCIKITPENYENFFGFYYKYAMRNAMDIATIGCAVSLKTKNQNLEDFRIAYGVAGPVPMRCPNTEKYAAGQSISASFFRNMADCIETDVTPRTSWRATRKFRINIVRELSKRTTLAALKRAGVIVK